jgi:4-methyl-5(b-hydroxyethyl)-thiazole monophosphate biosynthesis
MTSDIKRVLVPIADGSEEIEAVCLIDILRRAGAEVTVASVGALQITASRGLRIVADCLIDQCQATAFDLIALPGGMPGAERLRDSPALVRILKGQQARGAPYAAICAAPAVVLAPHGLLAHKRATCHPAFSRDLAGATPVDQRVVVDGNVVTSRGPGTALEFALALVALLFGEDRAAAVAAPLVMPPGTP